MMKSTIPKSVLKRWFTFESKREFISWLIGVVGMTILGLAFILSLLKLFDIIQSPSDELIASLITGSMFALIGKLLTDISWLRYCTIKLNAKIDNLDFRFTAKIDKLDSRLNTKADKSDIARLEQRIDDLDSKLNTKADKFDIVRLEQRLNELDKTKLDKSDPRLETLWNKFKDELS